MWRKKTCRIAGMDLLGGAGVCAPPIAPASGGAGGGVLFSMIKQKIIRDKMRYVQ